MNDKRDAHKFNTSDFLVQLGVHDLSNSNEEGRISATVNDIRIHPEWNVHVDSYDADIAILELSNEVGFNKFIRPICVPEASSNVASATTGTVIGFGITEKGTISDVAKKLEIPIFDYMNCSKHSSDHRSLISPRTFCGGSADGNGVCSGDSGSGVYIADNMAYYLRGLVSSSLTNIFLQCDVNRQAIFTDVTKFFGWIKSGGLDIHAENRQRNKREIGRMQQKSK